MGGADAAGPGRSVAQVAIWPLGVEPRGASGVNGIGDGLALPTPRPGGRQKATANRRRMPIQHPSGGRLRRSSTSTKEASNPSRAAELPPLDALKTEPLGDYPHTVKKHALAHHWTTGAMAGQHDNRGGQRPPGSPRQHGGSKRPWRRKRVPRSLLQADLGLHPANVSANVPITNIQHEPGGRALRGAPPPPTPTGQATNRRPRTLLRQTGTTHANASEAPIPKSRHDTGQESS